jgi:hypothetical protein|tara:strand:+ start:536 stop:643 length:108 start_codon:yes stop_codon:yes gene_type:complete
LDLGPGELIRSQSCFQTLVMVVQYSLLLLLLLLLP